MPAPNDPHNMFQTNPATNNGLEHGQAYDTHDGNKKNDDPSTIGEQLVTEKIKKRALIELKKEMYFGQLADTEFMPKHMGKVIKGYVYVPLLDDANVNDQGIDAAGLRSTLEATITIQAPMVGDFLDTNHYVSAEGADAATALAATKVKCEALFRALGVFDTDYATTKAALEGAAEPWVINDDVNSVPVTGNLYGSSKDVGYISSRLPIVGEHGGRVNRVGFSRKTITGTMERFGFYEEHTRDSEDFDSDAQLREHKTRIIMRGANELAEDALQIDLLHAAGIVMYAGSATATNELSGEAGAVTTTTYTDLTKLSIMLDKNRCPTNTKIISGSRMVDTRVLNSARIMYIGSDLIPMVESMENSFGKPAFISREHYANAGNTLEGEIGTLYRFRVVVVPEMMRWEGAGATATAANIGFSETGGKYDVFPRRDTGRLSFTLIGCI